jgi:hypothetical protein
MPEGCYYMKALTFFYRLLIQSISEKYQERESLADLADENNTPSNSRQLSTVSPKTLAIH